MTTAGLVQRHVERVPPGTFVSAADFDDHSPDAVNSALSRLARSNADLVRVRKGLYWKGVASRFGPSRPDALAAALFVAGAGAGPAGISAAHALGLTTQLAARPIVAVLGVRPTGLSGVRFTSRSNLDRQRLKPLEIAVLEVLRTYPRDVDGSWDDLVLRIGDLVDRGGLRMNTICRVARSERKPQVRALVARLQSDLSALRAGGVT